MFAWPLALTSLEVLAWLSDQVTASLALNYCSLEELELVAPGPMPQAHCQSEH